MEYIIELRNVVKLFKHYAVLQGLNFGVQKGQLLGLIGKSGEGKTTFLRVMIGFYKIDSGVILFQGKDVSKNAQQIIKHIGYCTQDNSFYPELSIYENLIFYGKMYGMKSAILKQRVEELLKLVDLTERKENVAGAISGGMKRRLDLAIALLHNPDILILDEPTAGLDPIMTKEIWNLIEDINKKGTTVIVSSHELDNLERKCTSIAVLSKGKMAVYPMPILKRKYKTKSLMDAFDEIISDVEDKK